LANVLLLRGGQLTHLRYCDMKQATLDGRDCLLFEVLALKKADGATHRRYPILVPVAPGDPACAVAALARLFRCDGNSRPAPAFWEADKTPLVRYCGKRQARLDYAITAAHSVNRRHARLRAPPSGSPAPARARP